jgi:hypothetical protein
MLTVLFHKKNGIFEKRVEAATDYLTSEEPLNMKTKDTAKHIAGTTGCVSKNVKANKAGALISVGYKYPQHLTFTNRRGQNRTRMIQVLGAAQNSCV